MAYEKQTWTNDVTAITAERMTHIENGIYDNSLATDKINPSGTATTTAEIEEGQITDVIGFKSLKLKGQTSQYTTTGKNKYDLINATLQSGTMERTSDKTGFILRKGTNRVNNWACSFPAGTYTIQFDLKLDNSTMSTQNLGFTPKNASQGNITSGNLFTAGTKKLYTFTATEDVAYLYFFINNNESSDCVATISNFMVMDGTISTGQDYEPYTGGKASPNPDYPQEVNNVSGYNVVEINNKNLIEYSFKGYNINSQGKFETGGSSLDFDVHIAKVKAGTTYTITPATNVIAYFDEKPTITSQAYNNSREVITSTNRLTPTRSGYIAMRTATSNTAQVEIGSSATSFVAHQGNNFEINLGKNLFNKDDSNNTLSAFINGDTGAITSYDITRTLFIPCLPNTTYSFSRKTGTRLIIGTTSVTPSIGGTASNITTNHTANQVTYTTNSSAKYLCVFYYKADTDTITNEEMRDTIQIEKGAIATPYAPYFPPIEICKIGTYQDYIFKRDGKWYKHKEVGKVVWNGTESWQNNAGISTTYVIARPSDLAQANNNVFYNYFSTVADLSVATEGARIGSSINLKNPNTADLASFKTWLGTNNVEMYYQSTTPTDEEITYAPLLRQLDELYNSGLYDVTNISQDNSSEAFILDIEACKNNINGIVEYIRR